MRALTFARMNESGGARSALVTGASTGIGYAIAAELSRNGFAVYAGVRSETDAQRLRALHENIQPVTLDVERSGDIEAAAHLVRERALPLAGIVNNAGIAFGGPLEYLSIETFRKHFDVNVVGTLAVTQAFLPLLRASKGRIVFMTSVSGQIAPPFNGPYASSKFALEALADSLRMELLPFGIDVVVVAPGNVRTPIWQKGRDACSQLASNLPEAARMQYGKKLEQLLRITEHAERTAIDPEAVAKSVAEILTTRRPRTRYFMGEPPQWQRRIAALLPDRWRDDLILQRFNRS